MKIFVSFAVAVSLVGSAFCQSRNFTEAAPDMRPTAPENITKIIGIDSKLGKVVPLAVKFNEADGSARGKDILLRDLVKDRPVIVLPAFYTCKSTCPLMFNGVLECIRNFKELKLGVDYDIVTIGIKPSETVKDAMVKRDELIHVSGLAKIPNLASGWHLLTGTEENIRKITNAMGYRYGYNRQQDKVQHPAGIIILTPDGIISRYFYGMEYVPKLVSNALKDAKLNRVGPEAPKIFFGCLEMDAMTGRYTLVVKNTLIVAGTFTVLVLLGSILYMSRKYRETNSDARIQANMRIGGGPVN